MHEESGDGAGDEITALFEEYLASLDSDQLDGREALLARAGDGAAELAARIETHDAIRKAVRSHAPLPSLAALDVPQRIGRFEIRRFIDEGGLGRVYLANDPELGRDVALKVLGSGPESDRAMVLNEARSIARLEHPGVVRVFEVGAAGGDEYVVMEHLPGPSLWDVIYELRRMRDPDDDSPGPRPSVAHARTLAQALRPFSARVECMLEIAEALAYCHDRGVLHRDAKPANVLFSADDSPKLIDFGLAHLDDSTGDSTTMITQRLMGTPAYIAPEQIEQGKTGADPSSDQFAFGVVCYEMLGLPHPFAREGRMLTLDAIARATPKPPRKLDPSIPADLERVVLHCLERSPEDRYPGMAAVADDLRAIVEHRPISVREPSLGHALRLWASRNRQPLAWLAVTVVATTALVGSQAAWRAYSARASVRDAAAALDLAAAEVVDLRGVLEELTPLQGRAARLDSELWASVFGPTAASVQDAQTALSDKALATLEQKRRTRGEYFQFFTWRSFLQAAQAAIPGFGDRTVVRDFLRLGRVALSPVGLDSCEVRIYAREALLPADDALTAYAVYRRLDFDCSQLENYDLRPGLYRILAWSRPDEPPRELEFFKAEHTDPPRVLQLANPRVSSWRGPFGADGRIVKIVTFDPGLLEERFPLPAFKLSDYVTVGDFNRFRDSTGAAPIEGSEGEPAIVTWLDALHYATWSGARLPTAWELDAVAQEDLIHHKPDSVAAEWVTDPGPAMGAGAVGYLSYGRSTGLRPLKGAFGVAPRDSVPSATGGSVAFRLAASVDSAEALDAFWKRVEEVREQ